VTDSAARLLDLLGLLQTRRTFTGTELAARLAVSTRTVRTDIERLRGLGYRIDATPGVAGGYRLDAGTALPPLLLDDAEAVAVAVALRAGAGGAGSGLEEMSLRALLKLEQVLPSRLRRRLRAMTSATAVLGAGGTTVDPQVLITIAAAVRDREQLRFDYTAYDGAVSRRRAEPHRLVSARGHWYLVGWDVERADWRTYRVDRLRLRVPNGPRFAPRSEPAGGFVAYVEQRIDTATWHYHATVLVHAPADAVVARLPRTIPVEPVDADSCRIRVGSDDPGQLALWLGLLDADLVVEDGSELVDHLQRVGERYLRAAVGSRSPRTRSMSSRRSAGRNRHGRE
jgi:predicted DNA-binding transcriptional regulator YafY